MCLWQLNVTGLEIWWFSTLALMYAQKSTKGEYVLSAISVKGFPFAVGLSQENEVYTPTEAMNTEWIGMFLYCAYIFITCHSQKNKLLSREKCHSAGTDQ